MEELHFLRLPRGSSHPLSRHAMRLPRHHVLLHGFQLRLSQQFNVVDPAPVTDNRASLLRPGTAPRKIVNEKDISMHLWKNYISFACRVVPPIPSPVMRCASPDIMFSSMGSSYGSHSNST
eukprot:TRINITY_DN4190_c0_g1_i1.p1 TRINITY_DN4190_c0_g1~~TRINITY_DN4190_c0_g1_i1.p1  ORF type:complete len:121 (+),score=31.92 TRINITY_DN4190_c0_g1_i1:81-443(+)